MTPFPSRNVLGGPLKPCSIDPMTGFFREGRCDTCAEDQGCHTVCVEVTADFLEFSRLAGNDLSTPRPEYQFVGLTPGDRWCLCAPVSLASTHERTLEIVPLDLLQRHATA